MSACVEGEENGWEGSCFVCENFVENDFAWKVAENWDILRGEILFLRLTVL